MTLDQAGSYLRVIISDSALNLPVEVYPTILTSMIDRTIFVGVDLDGDKCIINGRFIEAAYISTFAGRQSHREFAEKIEAEDPEEPTWK